MASDKHTVKPWAGRFTGDTQRFVEEFTESVSFDRRLYGHDIAGSIAHVQMLVHSGVLAEGDGQRIVSGLRSIRDDIEAGCFEWRQELEDVHMNIESALVERVGDVGKKLHTGRSRNDQVATDLRLYLRAEVDRIRRQILSVLHGLLRLAEQEAGTIMPGFTHLQSAQPVTVGHHLLAWASMFRRDLERLQECRARLNRLPLGAAALAGTSYPIDRRYTAELLDFHGVIENSLDAVSDRDFAVEFCAAAALVMLHLSRICEELVLWMSPRFGFIALDDAFCTGSSIMPQKKNPDVPELIRGKTGRVYGALMALLTLMKAQPLAYNRDNQEDKLPIFDTVDTVMGCLQALAGLIPGIRFQHQRLAEAAAEGYATATDLADYLVRKGIAFRDAHRVVGELVQLAQASERVLDQLSLDELRQYSDRIEADVFEILELNGSIAARNHIGGTAPEQVRLQLQKLRSFLNKQDKTGSDDR